MLKKSPKPILILAIILCMTVMAICIYDFFYLGQSNFILSQRLNMIMQSIVAVLLALVGIENIKKPDKNLKLLAYFYFVVAFMLIAMLIPRIL